MNFLIAASILAFASAAPVDFNTVDYSGVDWKTVDYSGIDWNTVDYGNIDWKTVNYNVDWKTVNYNGAAATPTATAASTVATASATPTGVANGFTLISSRSGSNVHLLPIYAKGNKLQLGGTAPQSCTPPGVNVPVQNYTSYQVSPSGNMGLRVVVPGGQQVYVAQDGTVSYTTPHSGNTGTGSTVTGFSLSDAARPALQFQGKRGFAACPDEGVYTVTYLDFSSRTDCLGIDLLATDASSSAAAWEW